MSNLLKLDFRSIGGLNRRGGATVLGLTLDGSRLEGVWLRRPNGSLQITKAFSANLALDPLTNAPELVGREIRNHLQEAGVRERECVVGLPLKWALTTQVKLPELSEADMASFLQLEAERGFPCDVSTLIVGTSRYRTPEGVSYATLVGLPRSHIASIERALRAAQLRPRSFSLGLPAMQPSEGEESNGVLALAIGETCVGLQVTCGGGIAALRTLEGALESEGAQRRLQTDVLAREARITLAQLPADVRQTVRRVRLFGPRDLAQRLADEIELKLEALDLQVDLVAQYAPGDLPLPVPPGTAVSSALSLAAGHLAGRPPRLEYLPPHVTAWQQFANRYSSGKIQQAGIAAGIAALLVGGVFGFQQWQIWRLETQWQNMKTTVVDLEQLQSKIRQFRAWNDESLPGMSILRRLTEAFPEDGSVTAKTLEIREATAGTCTGVARDYPSLLKTIERLRSSTQFREVNLGQTRGQAPAMQFTFSFFWNEGGASAN